MKGVLVQIVTGEMLALKREGGLLVRGRIVTTTSSSPAQTGSLNSMV